MIEDLEIMNVLQKEVTKAVNGKLPVKYLNVNFNVPNNGKWWEIIYLPNNRENEYLSDGQTYMGVLNLLLHWPQDNKGIYNPTEELKRIAEYFAKGNKFYNNEQTHCIQITDNPLLKSIVEDTPNLIIPLTIKYLWVKV